MPGHQPPVSGPDRMRQITAALRLVGVSVIFGVGSGAVSVATGLANHSLSVLAVGLGVMADVTGSATLVWRFRAERRQPGRSQAAEARSAVVVAAALAVVSAVITIQAVIALAAGSRPGTSAVTLIAAAVTAGLLAVTAGQNGAVRVEERMFHKRWAAYDDYRAQVPRWLKLPAVSCSSKSP